jgi:hypothetical protein
MQIKFAVNFSDDIEKYITIFNKVENKINSFISSNAYGDDLSTIYIGWICVSPEFSTFFTPRKPKVYKTKEISDKGNGNILSKELEYEIMLNYDDIRINSEHALEENIVSSIITTLPAVIEKSGKFKDFQIEKLISDINQFY